MNEATRCREAFEAAGHDRMDFWSVWRRAWNSRGRSDAKKNRSARLHARLEREAQRQRTEYIKELELDVSTWKEAAATFEDFYRKTEAELEALKETIKNVY